jgi:hypothetical protein
MAKYDKKLVKKLEYQAANNPGHKKVYEQPSRPRSAVFHSKKEYNRQSFKKFDIEE